MKLFILLFLMTSITSLHARTWTSKGGKNIEATFVKLEGEMVTILKKGSEYKLPLDKLSEADQEFVKKQVESAVEEDEPAEAANAETSLKGKTLAPGKRVDLEIDLSDEVIKALRKNKLTPTKAKIAVMIPEGFNPNKPQKVFWTVGGINNEAERLRGNLGRFNPMAKAALSRGWVVIAADTDKGNPRESTVKVVDGDLEFHQFVVDEISKDWKNFKSWKHACGGNSSGAKASFFRTAQLLKSDVNVVGMFLSGCNGSYAAMAAEETRVKKGGIRKVKVWLSHGNKDKLVNAGYTASVLAGIKEGGYRTVRSESFDGTHAMNQTEYGKALDWFAEEK